MTAEVRILRGDLTKDTADAIVNAANQKMLGGGGVDGAIHRAAGPSLLEACRAVPEVLPGVRCPTGEARITPGFELPARYVIHTVGPVYSGSGRDPKLLASAFRSPIELAIRHRLRSIAFPAVSCGVYAYPIQDAAAISVKVVREQAWDLDEIRFVLFSEDALAAWTQAFT
jgi:O-acetyl-ADP-ribose deacetylase (regulator of RNase III)